MEIIDLVKAGSVFPHLKAVSKKQVLQELSEIAEKISGLASSEVFDILLSRERLGTTGVGQGVAIPHGKFPKLKEIHGAFVRMEEPVDFEALDDEPVDLIFLLLVPEDAGANHLKALARVSRLLRDKGACAKLRGAENADAIYAVLKDQIIDSELAS